MLKRIICAAICACMLLACLPVGCFAAAGKAFTELGGVRFYGGAYLETIDFSAVIRDRSTVTDKTLHLCRVYDEGTAYESADRIANFVFDESRIGTAVLDDYPGAEAKIEPGSYVLRAADGCLFDDTDEFRFSAADYYKNGDAAALPVWRPARVGLPAFDGYTVTKADGETVYELEMTLSEDLAAFYDTLHPEAPVQIECKYGYDTDDVFAVIDARAKAYDPASGVLTIELLNTEGEAGTNLHNFCIDAESYGYIFKFIYGTGLFSCGAAQSMYAFRQISGKAIGNMPTRVFSETRTGQLYEKLHGKLWSEKRFRRAFAFTTLCLLSPVFLYRLAREAIGSVSAFDGNIADAARAVLRETARKYLS